MSLPVDVAEEYWQAVTVLEAQEIIEQVKVVQVPYYKPQAFKKYASDLEKKAFPKGSVKASGPELDTHQLAALLGDKIGAG